MGASSSAGVTAGAVADTMVVPYNDLKAVDTIIREYYGLKPITDKKEESKAEGESDAD